MQKRIFLLFLVVVLLLVGGGTISFAAPPVERAYAWYFKRTPDHSAPPLPPEFSFLYETDGYYLDPCPPEGDKVLYLTFDAGYENGNIAKILDTLAAHHATGAFFILENLITREPDLVRRMAADGHTVCNHTAHHKDMTRLGKAAFCAELDALAESYQTLTGSAIAPFYRPPEGRFTRKNLEWAKEMGYKTIFWSFAYADWDNNRQPDTEKALEKLTANLHNGEVLLLHPTSATNAAVLDAFLTHAEREGYRFGTLGELCSRTLPREMWRTPSHCLPDENV